MNNISTQSLPKKYVEVLGKQMAYCEMGEGKPIIFQHGNPTSSYLWRNIMPHMESQGRCIAIDLIGMGDSDKLKDFGNNTYSYQVQKKYFDACLEALDITDDVTLVIHDWGSALGFNWAQDHPSKVKAICYMEGIVRPLKWEEWSKDATRIFQGFRSDAGEEMILKKNLFIEAVLPGSIIRDLSEDEMNEYRKPFQSESDRQPTLDWPRHIPLDNEPKEMAEVVQVYADWMAQNEIPKLFINAEPGAILIGPQREFCRTWKNQTEVTVKGTHFIQEDSPHEIGSAIKEWLEPLIN
jgi:haloalkane dehalogenase|tara:strand:+ start:286 stop:1170 length:885 start_codon:yes stop_codon:yes gene_type:complete